MPEIPRVLIVDDSVLARRQLSFILRQNGFDVAGEAANGQDAVARYRALRPDLVTMDLTMSLVDGIEATRAILLQDPRALVVVVSAVSQEEAVLQAVQAGARGYLVKPYQPERLVDTLRSILLLAQEPASPSKRPDVAPDLPAASPSGLPPELARHAVSFVQEALEHLATLDGAIQDLAALRGSHEALGRIHHSGHTLRGMAAMMGQGDLAALAGSMETLAARTRSGDQSMDGNLIALFRDSAALLRRLVENFQNDLASGEMARAMARRLENPLVPADPEAPRLPAASREVDVVLIVDDDGFTRKVLGRFLTQSGYVVVTAVDGEDGLAKALNERPDLIILDLLMPRLQGTDVLRRLHANPATADVPIIVVTARNQLEDKLGAFDLGADDYVTKPFEPAEVVARVKHLLAAGKPRQTRSKPRPPR